MEKSKGVCWKERGREREREREREEEEQSTEVRDSARHELFSAPAV